MREPWEDIAQHDAEAEEWLNNLPVCCVCGEPIQDEDLYDFDGDLICDSVFCLDKYLKKQGIRKSNTALG